jgi:hypothetical protein
MLSQRPRFLTRAPEPARPRPQPYAEVRLQFEKLHARIVSRDYADDTEVKLSLLSHELRIIMQLLTERN